MPFGLSNDDDDDEYELGDPESIGYVAQLSEVGEEEEGVLTTRQLFLATIVLSIGWGVVLGMLMEKFL